MLAFRILTSAATMCLPALASAQSGPPNTSPSGVEAGTYVIDPDHTQVSFKVLHMGFSYYDGIFSGASGELTLDPKMSAASTVRVSVPVKSVATTSKKLDGELVSADWLDAAKFPVMTFKSTTVTPSGKGEAKVMGDLTLHGVTKPVTFEVRFVGSGVNPLDKAYTAGFLISGDIRRSEFGVTKYVPLIADTVHIEINSAFEKK